MVWTLQLASPQTEAMRDRQHVNADSAISRNRLGAIAISFRDKEADDPVREREYERYRGDIPMTAAKLSQDRWLCQGECEHCQAGNKPPRLMLTNEIDKHRSLGSQYRMQVQDWVRYKMGRAAISLSHAVMR